MTYIHKGRMFTNNTWSGKFEEVPLMPNGRPEPHPRYDFVPEQVTEELDAANQVHAVAIARLHGFKFSLLRTSEEWRQIERTCESHKLGYFYNPGD